MLALVVILGVGAAFVFLATPPAPPAECPDPTAPCGGPPVGDPADGPAASPGTGTSAAPLTLGAVWRSSEFGFEFEYDPERWRIEEQDGRSVQLSAVGRPATLYISGAPASDGSPEEALRRQLDAFAAPNGNILGITEDTRDINEMQGPSIGYVNGVGDAYAGTLDTPQGPRGQISLPAIAASDGRVTVVVAMVIASDDISVQQRVRKRGDSILKTFRWQPRP